ncbi:MAG: hypothetical protein ACRDQ5_22030 [Sciscionella sp.]
MSRPTATPAGFSIDMPDGFTPITTGSNYSSTEEIMRQFQQLFSVDPTDTNSALMIGMFSELGASFRESGIEFAAIGLFRSPDEPQRPVSALLTCLRMPSAHESTEIALAGLRETHEQSSEASVAEIDISAGRAVVTVDESVQSVPVTDTELRTVSGSTVTAWVPSHDSATIAVVSVFSNSTDDWPHVCDTALDIFDSLSWDTVESEDASDASS